MSDNMARWARFVSLLPDIRNVLFLVGENALEWLINLLALIMIERAYGPEGLGTFAFLMAVYYIVGYLAQVGVPHHLEFVVASLGHDASARDAEISRSRRALFWAGAAVTLGFMLTADPDTSITRVDEGVIGYLLVGVTIWIRNLGHLKIAVLHGSGRLDEAAKQVAAKRIAFLALIFLLTRFHLPPSLLMAAYLLSEMFHVRRLSRIIEMPRFRLLESTWSELRRTFREGYGYLFTRDCLDIVIYLDFLILGFFVSSWKLGTYSEASIIARFFLIIPVALRPAFRYHICSLWRLGDRPRAARFAFQSAIALFTLNAIVALIISLHFDGLFETVFQVDGQGALAHQVFEVLLPGLLLFSTVTCMGAVYEVSGRIAKLKRLVLSIGLLNLLTNVYLVPYAGPLGAAAATSFSLIVYFFNFGSGLTPMAGISKRTFFIAAASLYPLFVLFRTVHLPVSVTAILLCLTVPAMLYVFDFFTYGQTRKNRITQQKLKEVQGNGK